METKHTPGPWGVDILRAVVMGTGGFTVADCDWSHHFSNEEKAANATLIAEAPAMLEALEDLVDLITEGMVRLNGAKLYPAGEARVEEARAAIARATGAEKPE